MKDDTAKKIAELLLQIKAIKLQPDAPFTWASGWKSPIYCDNRIALSYPDIRTYIRQSLVKKIEAVYGAPDVIAAVAMAAIAQGAYVAQEMGLPFVYVRSAAKEHGRKNLIEGELKDHQSAVVVEDLISTGSSSIKAVQALRDAGCNVKGMISIFTYSFNVAEENFKAAKCKMVSLCNYEQLLQVAVESNYIASADLQTLKEWRMNPEQWGR